MRLVPILVLLSGGLAEADPSPSTTAVVELATAAYRTCALHADRSVSCWGHPSSRPIGVPALRDALELQGLHEDVCARFAGGDVKCLGLDNKLTAQPLADVVALDGACARTKAGELWCRDPDTWQRVTGVTGAIAADGWAFGGCAVRPDRRVVCWAYGTDATSRLLIGAAADGSPREVAGVANAVQVAVGHGFACARLDDGKVRCWGDNHSAELGRGTRAPDPRTFTAAGDVRGLADAVDLIAGLAFACARRKTGTLACWGAVPWKPSAINAPEALALANVRAVATSATHTCALGTGRDAWCWGENQHGQLGDGIGPTLYPPRELAGVTDATAVHVFDQRTCVARRSGAVTCYGRALETRPMTLRGMRVLSSALNRVTGLDAQGRLWIEGERTPRPTPPASGLAGSCVLAGGKVWCSDEAGTPARQVAGIDDAVEVDGRCARRKTGAIACFDGSIAKPTTIDDAVALGDHCAIRKDLSVWCWELDQPPAKVPGVAGAIAIAGGESYAWRTIRVACAIRKAGGVACWGTQDGLLAGTTAPQPIAIAGITDAVALSVGPKHACALTKRGTVACWGAATDGETGTAASRKLTAPQRVVW